MTVSKAQKELEIKIYVKNHPDLSAQKVIDHFKGTAYSSRKTDALRYVREQRGQPHVDPIKIYSSTPKKYRKGPAPVPEAKTYRTKTPEPITTKSKQKALSLVEGSHQYMVAHIRVDGKLKHIKFNTASALNKQIAIFSDWYDVKESSLKHASYTGPYKYHGDTFVAPEYREYMEKRRR